MTLDSPLGKLSISQAVVTDAPVVRALRDEVARWMGQRGIRQWSPGDLSDDWIAACIAFGEVYLVTSDGHLAGSVTIVWDDPLIWGEQPERAGYIHMLMLDRAFAGHGIGRLILAWAEDRVVASGRQLARLDCVEHSESLRAYYEAEGYRFVGTKSFPELDWAGTTALYEKRLPR